MTFSARIVAFMRLGKIKPTAATNVRRQFRLSGSQTANIPRTAPIAEVLTLASGVGQIAEPSVAFPRRPPWSTQSIPRELELRTHRVLRTFVP